MTSASRPLRRILIDGLETVASVGIHEVEHRYEQRIVVSLDLSARDRYDGMSERLADVLDYSAIVAECERIAQSRHFKLIETLAERLAEACLLHQDVERVRVRIEKPDVMATCRSVGIEIERAKPA